MDLRKLRHMLVLSEELNFVRAAARLHLTQPALSRSIVALEHELNCQLFDRTPQGVRVTPVGQQVVVRARQLLLDARSLQQEVDMLLRREVGNVKLGAGPLPLATLLPPLLAEMMREQPRVRVEVESQSAPILLEMLLDGSIEFFVADVSALPVDRRISIQRLTRQSARAYCRAGHPLLGTMPLSPSELIHYQLISGRRSPSAEAALARFFELPDDQPFATHLVSDSVSVLIRVALDSDAILLATPAAVHGELQRGTLQELAISPALDRQADIAIVHLAGWTLSPAAQWMIERLLSNATPTH
ncbi:LysR family transcriptional regulator [Pseudomonas sp. H9]|uniref:LysR family transcriptional regulator n=1 Tax=Pseudomonas sp. H9 TaxID=483968 RepID=UPI001057E152|nr:LysR family transcriptional regulator [Pseudomonas sp. H9]TDF83788.1 LysR family transcriptional regulator [Pseudomonas sp. H9]